MKKLTVVLIILLLMILCSACGTQSRTDQDAEDSGQINIVTTIFPEYDWTMNILGENPGHAQVTMMMDSGVDMHSFQPTPEDMLQISESDLFIYVGGESDEWVEDALKQAGNQDRIAINLLDVLGENVKEEEVVEGMEAEEEHDEEGNEAEEEGPELDEHVWLSLNNAQTLCTAIEEAIAQIDPQNAENYEQNLKAYIDKIQSLDKDFRDVTSKAARDTLVFGDRFPFRYMTDEYGLKYYAAFAGCSAETEASFETIRFLADKVDELDLSCIMTIEGSDQKMARTIRKTSKNKAQKILTLDSMQSVTARDVDAGASYLTFMQENLDVLEEALK